MTSKSDLIEEIADTEAEINRLKASMNREGNGEKNRRIAVKSRTLARLRLELQAIERRGVAA